ncbi:GNAT family N-acetyltransferase [Cellulomonas sp. URHB0016]
MGPSLSTAAERTVHGLWAARLRVPPATFDAPGTTFVERAADFPAVVVVELDGAIVVTGPPPALDVVRSVVSDLLDGPALVHALAAHGPSLVGSAILSYADAGTAGDGAGPADSGAQIARGSAAGLEDVLLRCSDDERDECGLADATEVLVLTDRTGRPAAAAGYEVWDDAVAHVGVAVAADRRGHGHGRTVAASVTRDALAAGLVAQWRARPENLASTLTAERLGYVRRGTQVAVDLHGT